MIVFYDGECGLCHRTVQFLLKHDRKKVFKFAPLQGETAHRLVPEHTENLDTLVFVDKKNVYLQAEAVFRICGHLSYPWKFLSFFPGKFFNPIYRLVAQNRYKLSCDIPKSRETDRFLK